MRTSLDPASAWRARFALLALDPLVACARLRACSSSHLFGWSALRPFSILQFYKSILQKIVKLEKSGFTIFLRFVRKRAQNGKILQKIVKKKLQRIERFRSFFFRNRKARKKLGNFGDSQVTRRVAALPSCRFQVHFLLFRFVFFSNSVHASLGSRVFEATSALRSEQERTWPQGRVRFRRVSKRAKALETSPNNRSRVADKATESTQSTERRPA